MKKLLSFILTAFLASCNPASAQTEHFSLELPVIGNTSVWGTQLNSNFNAIDSALWDSTGGLTIGVNTISSATSVSLTNPIDSVQQVTFTASGQHLEFPAMNATASPIVGSVTTVTNEGSNAFSILAQDGSTVILSSLLAGQTAYLTLTSGSTANGTFSTFIPAGANSGAISAPAFLVVGTSAPSGDGMYSAAANTLSFSANSTDIVNIGTTGLTITGTLGIGTTTPNLNVALDASNTTGAILLPVGTTAQEPSGVNGMLRYNSTTPGLEAYYNSGWNTVVTQSAIVPTVYISGSGTYTTPVGATYLRVRLIGGGGGGGGSGGTSGINGGSGGSTSFGTSLLSATGGLGGITNGGMGGVGGSPACGSVSACLPITGGYGAPSGYETSGFLNSGGQGCSSPFGGAGSGGGSSVNTAGSPASSNSGSGGGGGSGGGAYNGSGGGCGGYLEAFIPSPASSYLYAVGAAGTAGTAGSGGTVGGAGGSGVLIIEAF